MIRRLLLLLLGSSPGPVWAHPKKHDMSGSKIDQHTVLIEVIGLGIQQWLPFIFSGPGNSEPGSSPYLPWLVGAEARQAIRKKS